MMSNSGMFNGTSTVPYKAPKTARYGYLYFLGDNEVMADGDVGNPVVLRYKFKPPQATGG